MIRLKTKHSYHDANISSVTFEQDARVVFEIRLCGCSDLPDAIVHLAFHAVRNIDEVRQFTDGIKGGSSERQGRFAEIIGFHRNDNRGFVLDLDVGPVYLDSGGFTET